MSINLNDNLQNNSNKALDNKSGVYKNGVWQPYANVQDALNHLTISYRHIGLKVVCYVGGEVKEYWFKNGIQDWHLVPFIPDDVKDIQGIKGQIEDLRLELNNLGDECNTNNTFESDLPVVLPDDTYSFGKYKNGDTIPCKGWTIKQMLIDAITGIRAATLEFLLVSDPIKEVGDRSDNIIGYTINKGTEVINSFNINEVNIPITSDNPQTGTKSMEPIFAENCDCDLEYIGTLKTGLQTIIKKTSVRYEYKIFAGNMPSKPATGSDVRNAPVAIFEGQAFPSFTYETGTVDKNFIVAIPVNWGLASIVDETNLNLNITDAFKEEIMQVPDASGLNFIAYKVYTMSNVLEYSISATHKVTIQR